MKEPKALSIYVDIDALLDFRIATIASISEEAAVRILKNGYHERITDVFDGIDESQYHDLYKRRGIETVGQSRMTSMVFILKSFIAEIANESINGMGVRAKLTINTYPVEFDEEVQIAYAGAMNYWLGDEVDIQFVSHSPEEFDHDKLIEYVAVVKYEYGEWLNNVIPDLITKPCRNTILIVPSIFFEKKLSVEEWKEESKKSFNPFEALQQQLMLLIQLNVVDTKFYSIIRPEDLTWLDDGAAQKVRAALNGEMTNPHPQSQDESPKPPSPSERSPENQEHPRETELPQEPHQDQEIPPEEPEFLAL